jgi:hypothetical protein
VFFYRIIGLCVCVFVDAQRILGEILRRRGRVVVGVLIASVLGLVATVGVTHINYVGRKTNALRYDALRGLKAIGDIRSYFAQLATRDVSRDSEENLSSAESLARIENETSTLIERYSRTVYSPEEGELLRLLRIEVAKYMRQGPQSGGQVSRVADNIDEVTGRIRELNLRRAESIAAELEQAVTKYKRFTINAFIGLVVTVSLICLVTVTSQWLERPEQQERK